MENSFDEFLFQIRISLDEPEVNQEEPTSGY
jgi:hypothetical protein